MRGSFGVLFLVLMSYFCPLPSALCPSVVGQLQGGGEAEQGDCLVAHAVLEEEGRLTGVAKSFRRDSILCLWDLRG
jgi:hypothetical protein